MILFWGLVRDALREDMREWIKEMQNEKSLGYNFQGTQGLHEGVEKGNVNEKSLGANSQKKGCTSEVNSFHNI